jgi:Ca2+-binding RTX toxin-like protein
MAKTINLGSSNSDYTIEKSGNRYLLAEGDVFSFANIVTDTGKTISNIELVLDGTLTGRTNPVEIGSAGSKGNTVIVGETGIVDATNTAIFTTGTDSRVINRGVVIASDPDNGIAIGSDGDGGRIVNSGFLKGAETVVVDGDKNVVVNTGQITTYMAGTAVAFLSETGEANRFVNKSFIQGSDAFRGSDGNETFINRAAISGDAVFGSGDDVLKTNRLVNGDIYLGNGDDRAVIRGKGDFIDIYGQDGDDIFDLRGVTAISSGTTIAGGMDDDTYIVTRSDLLLDEDAAGGTDTVKSSVSLNLADHFERLVLTGNKEIDGTGNASANRITGNAESNRILGMAGTDTLDGGRGNDTISGGSDADSYVFRAHSGRDLITDFADGADEIDLSSYEGIDGFGDLNGRISQKGADTVITLLDGDRITLDGFTATNLDATDFQF